MAVEPDWFDYVVIATHQNGEPTNSTCIHYKPEIFSRQKVYTGEAK